MPFPILVLGSNIGRISHRFRDMASFPLKTHIFCPPSFNPNLKMFFLKLIPEILHARVSHTWLSIHAKSFSLLVWQGTSVRDERTDRQTDRQTDDSHANRSTVT